jgi:hypothetical protein
LTRKVDSRNKIYKADSKKVLGLESVSLLTSLHTLDGGALTWDGANKAEDINWAPNHPAELDCARLTMKGLKSTPCDVPSNFMCESKPDVAKITNFVKLFNTRNIIYIAL